ncbi:hypothetical protein [Rhizobium leguminosarum]|uniref:hypothetical protein n=1 Tax=Rhizobium leguminosarum TaxID=384 RepID=UPI0011AE17BC|nr:hypothetical protein [Rhizobium leguminosarum]
MLPARQAIVVRSKNETETATHDVKVFRGMGIRLSFLIVIDGLFFLFRDAGKCKHFSGYLSVLARNYLLEFMTFQWRSILELSWAFLRWPD